MYTLNFRLDLYLKDQYCNATLRLNDTVAMSGGQVANITALDYNTTLYLGNAPNFKDEVCKPFIGCIKDLMVNIFCLSIISGRDFVCLLPQIQYSIIK